MEDYNTEYDLSSERMKKLDNRSQAGQCHPKNRGRPRKVPRRPNKWSQQKKNKKKTTVVAYRRNKLPVYPDLDALLVQFSIYKYPCSHSPYPKTMMLIFKTTGYYTKDGLLFLEIFYYQKKVSFLCDYSTTKFSFKAGHDRAASLAFFFKWLTSNGSWSLSYCFP